MQAHNGAERQIDAAFRFETFGNCGNHFKEPLQCGTMIAVVVMGPESLQDKATIQLVDESRQKSNESFAHHSHWLNHISMQANQLKIRLIWNQKFRTQIDRLPAKIRQVSMLLTSGLRSRISEVY